MRSRLTKTMLVSGLLAGGVLIGCGGGGDGGGGTGPDPQPADLAFVLTTPPGANAVATVSVEITGPGLDSTLVFNLTLVNGVASGTARVPAGSGRRIMGRAFDAAAVNTHRGDTTVTLVEGTNPPVSLKLLPLVGGVPLTLTFGTTVVSVSGRDTTLQVGDTIRYTATAVNAQGGAVPAGSILWASSNPAVASVSTSGLVTALVAGSTSIVATYEGAAASRVVTVAAPVTSPLRILFWSDRDGNQNIYAVHPDGSGLQQMTSDPVNEQSAAYSPDHSMLILMAERGGYAEWDIEMLDLATNARTTVAANPGTDGLPKWSPNGSLIGFTSGFPPYVANGGRIVIAAPDGSGAHRLTSNSYQEGDFSWSPDGSMLVFSGDPTLIGGRLYLINTNGSNQTSLPTGPGNAYAPAWSPNGARIAFISDRTGDREVYVINVDGTGESRVTSDQGMKTGVAWSPDGQWIAFGSEIQGNHDIYVIRADGTGSMRVTSSPANDYSPRWAN